jgi:hypothetical protein
VLLSSFDILSGLVACAYFFGIPAAGIGPVFILCGGSFYAVASSIFALLPVVVLYETLQCFCKSV